MPTVRGREARQSALRRFKLKCCRIQGKFLVHDFDQLKGTDWPPLTQTSSKHQTPASDNTEAAVTIARSAFNDIRRNSIQTRIAMGATRPAPTANAQNLTLSLPRTMFRAASPA